MPVSEKHRAGRAGSTFARIARTILWSIVVAFAIGFLIGTLLRRELERPVRYIGDRASSADPIATISPPDRSRIWGEVGGA
jgi:hypothetical protein